MYNDALNRLKTNILSAHHIDGPRLRTLVDQHLEDILQSVVPTDYVEDCLFQIDEALERLCASPQESLTLQVYLLGAIEALRDELHLCEVDMDVPQAAVGF
jgi:hypothetical protein